MRSHAMMNATQTPILASPRANIAGSQTNRFITASYFPLAPAPGSGPFEKRKTVVEALAQPSQVPLARRPQSTVPPLSGHMFDAAS